MRDACEAAVAAAPSADVRAEGAAEMLFMVIERFRDDDMVPVYERLRDAGRGMPEGLEFLGSWVEPSFARCFQLMRCDDAALLQQWVLHWRGVGATFEIVPVLTGQGPRAIFDAYLDVRSSPRVERPQI